MAVAVLLLVPAPLAVAQPATTDEPVAADVMSLPWTTLGLPGEIGIISPDTPQSFSVPIPLGTTAQRLLGRIDLPVDSPAGYLEIQDSQGTFLAAVDLPPVAAGRVTVPLDVDISAARVTGSSIGVSLTARQINDDLRCRPRQQITITDLSTVFIGDEPAPITIATFFPPVLERVNIYAPDDANQSEQQAVLTLASELARFYSPQPVRVTVTNQRRGAAPPPAGKRARAVVVERGSAELAVVAGGTQDAHLRISGQGDQLSGQLSLLANELQSLAQVPSARIDQPGASREGHPDTMTFRELNMVGNVNVLGAATLVVGVDRAALGDGRVDQVAVHLLADHTPVSADDSATVSVTVNGEAVHTAALDGSGRVDTTFELPGEVLRERINLVFELTYTPHLPCSTMTAPLRFWIDPDSTLTMRHGGAPAGDFSSLPSEFSPEFLVALDGTGPDQLSYATDVVVSVARLTGARLTPRVVDLGAAVDSETSALIIAQSKSLDRSPLQLPVGGDGATINVDLPTALRADIDKGIGSIQIFADPARGRTVVVVTTTAAWNLVPPLLNYLNSLQAGWADLAGNVLAAGAQGTPTDLSVPVATQAPAPTQSNTTTAWVGIGVGIVALAIVTTWLWILRRRKASPPN